MKNKRILGTKLLWCLLGLTGIGLLIILITYHYQPEDRLENTKLEKSIDTDTNRKIEGKNSVDTDPKKTAAKNDPIPILMYHFLTYDSSKWNDSIISPDKFKEDMLYIKVLGYNPIHFKDYIEHVEKGSTLVDNPIVITFDDGYLNNYEYAYPILKELNMKATISVIGWSVGRKYNKDGVTPINEHFNWVQAKEMYDSGLIDIQHHTYDLHNIGDNVTSSSGVSKLPSESDEEYKNRFTDDTMKLKTMIEEKVGNDVIVFTYPYGIHNDITDEVIKDLGFKVSLTIEPGISDFSNGLYLLKRINMDSDRSSVEQMREILSLSSRNEDIPFININSQKDRIKELENLLKHRK